MGGIPEEGQAGVELSKNHNGKHPKLPFFQCWYEWVVGNLEERREFLRSCLNLHHGIVARKAFRRTTQLFKTNPDSSFAIAFRLPLSFKDSSSRRMYVSLAKIEIKYIFINSITATGTRHTMIAKKAAAGKKKKNVEKMLESVAERTESWKSMRYLTGKEPFFLRGLGGSR